MSNYPKNSSFVAFTTASADDTITEWGQGAIPNTIFVAAIIDPTMQLNLPPVADLDLTPVERPPEQQPVIVYLA